MIASVCILAATVAVMICGILFFPEIKIGKVRFATYWAVSLLGAICALFASPDILGIGKALIAPSAVNPIKILVLFLSMTALSVFLDEVGFFGYLAALALSHARSGQKKLFIMLYITVSILTVFTSNDVIILSFTPFICYFCKNAEINPLPYLAAEFVAANTWSMALIIGNPTNIYLALACGLNFLSYLKLSLFPTLFAGLTSFFCLYLLFLKRLKAPLTPHVMQAEIKDRFLLVSGVTLLAVCTVLLAIGQYIGLEMWIVSLSAALLMGIIAGVYSLIKRRNPTELTSTLKRLPYQLVPFVLSMFVIIVVLNQNGVTAKIGELLGTSFQPLIYGAASFFAANVVNNIPMSVLFSSIISATDGLGEGAVFGAVIGSNLGAYFTPVGALAGIMWSGIVKSHGVKFGYVDFLKIGVTVALPALFAAIGGLYLALLIF